MRYIYNLILFCIALSPLGLNAQHHRFNENKPDKTEWLRKMREYKHDYLIGELDLAPKQQAEFFRLYDAKQEEIFKAEHSVRRMEKNIYQKGDKATDAELDKCIDARVELNTKLAGIEAKYHKAFKKVLTKRQLFKLPVAERRFQRSLMEQRRDCPPPPQP